MKKLVLIIIVLNHSSFGQAVMDWVSLPQEVNNNVYSLTEYNGKLIAGGQFTMAGANQVNRIAAWDGTNWSPLSSGLHGGLSPLVYKTMVFNNELYTVGNFDSAGTALVKDIAKWNGNNWSNLGSGSNAEIYSIGVFNNEIYVGGTFDSIGGIAANHIAKWNGTNWLSLGTGIQGSNINDMCVYQNELYVIGVFSSAGSNPCNMVARWNGTNWNNASTGLAYGSSALIVKENKLISGSQTDLTPPIYPIEIKQWDGNNWSLFSQNDSISARAFLIFNNNLYLAGGLTALPEGYCNVRKWDSILSRWQKVGTGINDYTSGLCVYNNEIYCGGFFRIANGASHNFIARYTEVTGIKEYSTEKLSVNVYPIPTKNKFSVEINSIFFTDHFIFTIYDFAGKILYTKQYCSHTTIIDDFKYKGMYIWKLYNDKKEIKVGKIIIE